MSITDFIINDEKLALPLQGGPEQQKTVGHFGCFRVGICLLLVELCERFTFYEVVCNMIPFCTGRLGCYNHQAAVLNLGFIGASVLTPVFMGWLADEYLGRNKLVYISLCLHFLGTALLSVLAFPLEDFYGGTYPVSKSMPVEERAGLFHVALLTLSLGTGGIRAVVCVPDACGRQEQKSKKPMSFCNWTSWSMNLNAAVVFLGIASIQYLGSRAVVVLLPSLSVFTTLVTLYMKYYDLIYPPKNHCSLLTVSRAFVRALKTHCVQYCCLGRDGSSWLDHTVGKQGGYHSEHQEKETEKIFSALLPLFSFQLIYRMCLMQIPSGYYLQTMNSNRNWGGFPLPITLMNAVSLLPLLILAPFMDYLSNCLLPSKRDGPFLSACIIAGNICAASSVAVAGFLEIHRKLSQEQSPSGKLFPVSTMACMYLIPQYVLLGVAEVLVNPAVSMVTHGVIPSTFRGTSMTFLTLFHGSACFAGALLIELVYLISGGNWFPNTLNKGSLESFFFVLTSLTLLNILGLWRASPRYCNLNHFNAQRIHGNNCEETLLLSEKSLKFYGSTQETSSSIDLWETALGNWI
ncbi:solute carrier family 15 member 5 [Grammomys surdaster]|uniref:solute carrier family 15 member 5 n=1 Tax=Grammomys surdaster TaxID=491861 RepID=UPI00109F9631|nr:solute carrier family 15 member 5 [Grammomys surdaster]